MSAQRPRIAVVFDNRPRPETTGTYVRRALGGARAFGPNRGRRPLPAGRAPPRPTRAVRPVRLRRRRPDAVLLGRARPGRVVGDRHAPRRGGVRRPRPASRLRLHGPAERGRVVPGPRHPGRVAAARRRSRDPRPRRGCAAVRLVVRRPRPFGTAGRTARTSAAGVPEPLRRPRLLRGDGPHVRLEPSGLQPQRPRRRQHAGLRGGDRGDAADHERPRGERAGRTPAGRRAPRRVRGAGRPDRQGTLVPRPRGRTTADRRGGSSRGPRAAHLPASRRADPRDGLR